ncbi:MAG TPA: 4'-phosphopantetheinyl transferase superfamily protein, partial [Terriglobales bacterium]|nr:4'-phosphopantetheinyl transferase superfamily protein [Terriglobales bacterium]
VYWLEQSEADVPAENDWLSANEAVCLDGMRFAKRRADWRLGRWTAKRTLSVYLDVPAHLQTFKKIEIRPAPSGAPEAFFVNQPAAVTISISHRAGIAACAVAMSGVKMGCDLEMVEPRSDAFVADYFTLEEQALVARASAADRPRLLALLWSGKESALKALHEGLRLDTRSVIVSPGNAAFDLHGWSPMEVRHTDRRIFHGWWQHADGIVRTLVAAPPPNPPIRLRIPDYVPDAASLCM